MQELKEMIRRDGIILPGDILKVDRFLNHQIDIGLATRIGKEFHRLFEAEAPSKILTVETSGIAFAITTAQQFNNIPVIFAKKYRSMNMDPDQYTADAISYTRGGAVSLSCAKEYFSPEDRFLIIDDFLANGEAMCALIDICRQSGAKLVGCGAVIEKSYQAGRRRIEEQGIKLCSLACISAMDENGIQFQDD